MICKGLIYMYLLNVCVYYTDGADLIRRLMSALAAQETSNAGPATIDVIERSPAAKDVPDIRRRLYFECKRRQGILAVASPQADDRYVYNRSYGFRVNRNRGETAWRLAKICSADEMREQILANLNVAAPVSLDFVPARRVLDDATCLVKEVSAAGAGGARIVFDCDIKEREDYILKGGELVVDEALKITSFRTRVVFADRDAVISGSFDRKDGAVSSVRFSTMVDGIVLYERDVLNSDHIGPGEFELSKSPFHLASYGFQEPPVEKARLVPYLALGILVLLGAAIIFWVKRTATGDSAVIAKTN